MDSDKIRKIKMLTSKGQIIEVLGLIKNQYPFEYEDFRKKYYEATCGRQDCPICEPIRIEICNWVLQLIGENEKGVELLAPPIEASYSSMKFLSMTSNTVFNCTILCPKKEYKVLNDFLSEYWDDIDSLTDEFLQIYYNKKENKQNGGFEILKILKLNKIDNYLPSIFIWKVGGDLSEAISIPIKEFNEKNIFDTVQYTVNAIKLKNNISEIVSYILENLQDNRQIIYGNFIRNEINFIESNNNNVVLGNNSENVIEKTQIASQTSNKNNKVVSKITNSLKKLEDNKIPLDDDSPEYIKPTLLSSLNENEVYLKTINSNSKKEKLPKSIEIGSIIEFDGYDNIESVIIQNCIETLSSNISLKINLNIQKISILNSKIKNLEWVMSLPNLKELELINSEIQDFSPLEYLTKLEYLKIGNNGIGFDQIARLLKSNTNLKVSK